MFNVNLLSIVSVFVLTVIGIIQLIRCRAAIVAVYSGLFSLVP